MGDLLEGSYHMELNQVYSEKLSQIESKFLKSKAIPTSLKKNVLDLIFSGVPISRVARKCRVHPNVIHMWIMSFDSYCSYKLRKIQPLTSTITTRTQSGQKVCIIRFNSGTDLRLTLSTLSPRTKKIIKELA